jgi:hypothetical protein
MAEYKEKEYHFVAFTRYLPQIGEPPVWPAWTGTERV